MAIAIVAAGLVAGALPMFLIAALAPRIDADLGIGTRGTGIVVGAFFLAAALGSVPGGRAADRLGSRRALQIGLLITVVGTSLAASLGQGIVSLVLAMGLAGFALSFLDPGGARTLSAAVTADRHGMAFGVKEASIPMASLLAGASLPLIPSDVGWRPSFVGAAVLAAVVAVVVPSNLERRTAHDGVSEFRGGPAPSTTTESHGQPVRSTTNEQVNTEASSDPSDTWALSDPSAPSEPSAPPDPCTPSDPPDPCTPSDPSDPCTPSDPSDPSDTCAPSDSPDRADLPGSVPETFGSEAGSVDVAARGDSADVSTAGDRAVAALVADPRARRTSLRVLSLVAGLGGGTAAGFGTYLVTSAVAGGFSPEAAGIVFAVSSLVAVLVRLVVGRVADSGAPGRELRLLRGAMLIGAVGIAVSAFGTPGTAVLGGLIGLGAGWGWTGLVFLAAVRIDPLHPATASGVVLAGLAIGGVIGPTLFGLIAEVAGFATVFTLAAITMAVAGVVVTIPIRQVRTKDAAAARLT